MIIKASGRSALILLTGLFVCFAAPSQAATSADDAAASRSEKAAGAPIALHKNLGHGWHHRKHTAHAKFHRVAPKTAGYRQAAATDIAADNSPVLPDVPLRVANANAQLPLPGAPVGNTQAMQARANDLLQVAPHNPADARADNEANNNETLVVAADQLNDVDRVLHGSNPPAATSVIPSADPPAAPTLASSQETSTWDETSLIGKIFIAFGALLTMASAARMFMA
jgi:hypothetical protein